MLGHGTFNDELRPQLVQALLSHEVRHVAVGEKHIAVVTGQRHRVYQGDTQSP